MSLLATARMEAGTAEEEMGEIGRREVAAWKKTGGGSVGRWEAVGSAVG